MALMRRNSSGLPPSQQQQQQQQHQEQHKLENITIQELGAYYSGYKSRSVSWNSHGNLLAAVSEKYTKIWTLSPSASQILSSSNSNTGSSTTSSTITKKSITQQPKQNVSHESLLLREVTTLSGHNSGVERVRFHPQDPMLVCTSGEDRTVRLYDVRVNNSSSSTTGGVGGGSSTSGSSSSSGTTSNRSFGVIDLQSNRGACATSIEWQPSVGGGGMNAGKSHYLAVSEKDNSVHIYDIRKLKSNSVASSSNTARSSTIHRNVPQSSSSSKDGIVRSFRFDPHTLIETHFSPNSAYLVSAIRRSSDSMGVLHVYQWDSSYDTTTSDTSSSSSLLFQNNPNTLSKDSNKATLPPGQSVLGHTASIFAMKFSPNGQMLATGGADALIGLWDISTMSCQATVSSTTMSKFVRSVSWSHDSKIVASCTEEDGVLLSNGQDGSKIGTVYLHQNRNVVGNNVINSGGRNGGVGGISGGSGVGGGSGRGGGTNLIYPSAGSSSSVGGGGGGSDEVAFHPKTYLLACARGFSIRETIPQVSVAKFNLSS